MFATTITISVLIGLAAGIAILASVYIALRVARKQRASMRVHSVRRDIRINDIWKNWLQGTLDSSTIKPLRTTTLGDRTLAKLQNDLHKTERHILSQAHPLTALRREIMDSIDRQILQAETVTVHDESRETNRPPSDDDSPLLRELSADTLRFQLLRHYGAERYGDYAQNDWYNIYQQAAEMKRRSFRRFLTQRPTDADYRQYRSTLAVSETLKQRLLALPPGTCLQKS